MSRGSCRRRRLHRRLGESRVRHCGVPVAADRAVSRPIRRPWLHRELHRCVRLIRDVTPTPWQVTSSHVFVVSDVGFARVVVLPRGSTYRAPVRRQPL